MDLVLGTAQFGQIYGITNMSGNSKNIKELESILYEFKKHGFIKIDTAQSYGESEKMLGSIGVEEFHITSKIVFPNFCKNFKSKIFKNIELSLENLNVQSLDCLLAHNPDFLKENLDESLSLVEDLKSEGLIKSFGVSVYEPNEINNLDMVDVIQFPCSIFDRRFPNKFSKFDNNSHLIKQARSVFLQGLLLEQYKNIPQKFNKHKHLFSKYDALYPTKNEKLLACISYILNQNFDEFLVGVSSLNELQDILILIQDCSSNIIESMPLDINSPDIIELIDPRLWGAD